MHADISPPTAVVRRLVPFSIGLLLMITAVLIGSRDAHADDKRYQNPLTLRTESGVTVESCADPTVIQAEGAKPAVWYLYCTTDPFSGTDRMRTAT